MLPQTDSAARQLPAPNVLLQHTRTPVHTQESISCLYQQLRPSSEDVTLSNPLPIATSQQPALSKALRHASVNLLDDAPPKPSLS